MARVKVSPELGIASWKDVDSALLKILESETKIAEAELELNRKVAVLKEEAAKKIAEDTKTIDKLGKDIKTFVTQHKEEIPGKTKTLTHGQTGFRLSTTITIPKGKNEEIIERLKKLGMRDCINTKETINRETLRLKPLKKIELAGATWNQKDEFWYEIDKEELSTTP